MCTVSDITCSSLYVQFKNPSQVWMLRFPGNIDTFPICLFICKCNIAATWSCGSERSRRAGTVMHRTWKS